MNREQAMLFPKTNFPGGGALVKPNVKIQVDIDWDEQKVHASAPVEDGDYEVETKGGARYRSEEHTSGLLSPCNLICRLLLEKKKKKLQKKHINAQATTIDLLAVSASRD